MLHDGEVAKIQGLPHGKAIESRLVRKWLDPFHVRLHGSPNALLSPQNQNQQIKVYPKLPEKDKMILSLSHMLMVGTVPKSSSTWLWQIALYARPFQLAFVHSLGNNKWQLNSRSS